MLLQFMTEQELWSVLPQGTPTYHNLGETVVTTIDLMLLSTKLQPAVQSCQTDSVDHGSDHFAVTLTLRHMMQVWTTPQQRRSYNMANWDAIREMVREKLRTPPNIESADELEQAASQLETAVQQALEKASLYLERSHIPRGGGHEHLQTYGRSITFEGTSGHKLYGEATLTRVSNVPHCKRIGTT